MLLFLLRRIMENPDLRTCLRPSFSSFTYFLVKYFSQVWTWQRFHNYTAASKYLAQPGSDPNCIISNRRIKSWIRLATETEGSDSKEKETALL